MLRSVIDITREILIDAEINEAIKATRMASCNNSKDVMVGEEVGGASKSVDNLCNEDGAKKPYLVVCEQRKEGCEMAGNRYKLKIKLEISTDTISVSEE